MSEDLQTESVEDSAAPETEVASDSEPEQIEKVTFDERQQAKVDELIGGKVKQTRQAERDNADLRRQLDEAKARIPVEQRPEVAADVDIYSEDDLRRHETAIRAQARFDARTEYDADAEQNRVLDEQRRQTASFNDSLTRFRDTAANFDIDPAQMSAMDQTIGSYGGLNPAVGQFVINDDKGMLIYQHMAANPGDIAKVNGMDPMTAGVFLNDIKAQQTARNTKKVSDTPAPADRPDGGGVDKNSGQSQFLEGAKFE